VREKKEPTKAPLFYLKEREMGGFKIDYARLTKDTYEAMLAFPHSTQAEIYVLLEENKGCSESWRKNILKPNVGKLWNEIKGDSKRPTLIRYVAITDDSINLQCTEVPIKVVTTASAATKLIKWSDAHVSLVFRAKHRQLYEELEQAAEYNFRTLENEIMFRLFRKLNPYE
jgi:hypothetical protein